ELNRMHAESLKSTVARRYQGVPLRVVTRAALVALKYGSAVSPSRSVADKAQDVADLGHVVKARWSSRDQKEADRLVDLAVPGSSKDLDRLIDDLLHDRPITI